METTTTQSVPLPSTQPNQPGQALAPGGLGTPSAPAPSMAGNVLIHGAQRACELEPTVRVQCVRSAHAPAAKVDRPSATEPIDWDDVETIAPGAEVWQELVRMLVAREAAKLLHPAGRARA